MFKKLYWKQNNIDELQGNNFWFCGICAYCQTKEEIIMHIIEKSTNVWNVILRGRKNQENDKNCHKILINNTVCKK